MGLRNLDLDYIYLDLERHEIEGYCVSLYRILPNITAPPIEPPQLYSEVIEDNFLFKTPFTE